MKKSVVDEDDKEEEALMRPSSSQVMEPVDVAGLFFSLKEGEDDALCHVHALEEEVMTIAFEEKKQKVIADYFRQ